MMKMLILVHKLNTYLTTTIIEINAFYLILISLNIFANGKCYYFFPKNKTKVVTQ